jgi:hypothetical protein
MHCLDGPFLPPLSSPKSHSDPSGHQNVLTLSTSSCSRGNTMPTCCLVFWTPTLSRLSCCYNALCYQTFFYLLGFWCCITFQFHGALESLKKTLVPVCIWESQRLNKKWNEMVKMNIEMNLYSSLFTIALEPLEFTTTQLHRKKKFRNAHNLTRVFLQSNLHT